MTKPRYVNPECPRASKIIDHERPAVTVRVYFREPGKRQFVPVGWLCRFCQRVWTDQELTERDQAAANTTHDADQRYKPTDSNEYHKALYEGLMHQ